MKFIKTFEDINYSDVRNLEKLIGKYVIIKNDNYLELAKIINILGVNVELYEYDWDNLYNGYVVSRFTKNIKDMKVINYFDTFKECVKEYDILFKMQKYNL